MRANGRPLAGRLSFRFLAIATAAVVAMAVVLKASGVGARIPWPWRPSVEDQFPAASECATCHPTEVDEWQASEHARAARNPLVHASICGRCHAPLGTQFDAEYQLKLYDQVPMPEVPASAAEGVTCIVCHSRSTVPEEQVLTFEPVWPNWRTTDLALTSLPFDTALGAFGTGARGDPPPVANESHASLAEPGIKDAALCRPCHNVVVDKSPLAPHSGLGQARVRLLTTYDEWAASPYAAHGETGATEGWTCQSCHMPRRRENGPAAVAGPGTEYEQLLPARPRADHTFTGVSTEYLRTGPEVERQEERVAGLVEGAATVQLHVPRELEPGGTLTISVTVVNTGAGHDIPTGFAYWSEAWLEVMATDAGGRVLLASGDTDEDGWLRDEFNPRVRSGQLAYDAYLVSLRARLVTVGPNRSPWVQPDGTLQLPPDAIPRNLNGTPILGTADFSVDQIVRQVSPGMPQAPAGSPFQEGYILRFADTVVRNGLRPREPREFGYGAALGPSVRGPVDVSARLLIRALWPWMLQQQEELPTPRPRPRIYEMAVVRASVALGTP